MSIGRRRCAEGYGDESTNFSRGSLLRALTHIADDSLELVDCNREIAGGDLRLGSKRQLAIATPARRGMNRVMNL